MVPDTLAAKFYGALEASNLSGTNTGDNAANTSCVAKSTYDANSILYATTDDTPVALTVGEQTLVGRKTGGTVAALTATEVRTILNVADGATANTKATGAEIDTGTDDVKFATAKALADSSYAKTTDIPSMASSSDINTGTDTTKTLNSDAFAGSNFGMQKMQIKLIDDATALTTGDGKLIFMIPEELNGMNLVKAHAGVTTVSSSGTPTFQIRNVTDSVDMLSTAITIDANEYTSYTAATAPVIDTSHDDVATGDRIAIDCDTAGTGTKGAIIYLAFQLP